MTNTNGKSDMIPTESETTRTVGNLSHGGRETSATSSLSMESERSDKVRCHHRDVLVDEESDSSIVPEKLANKGGMLSPVEMVEERGLTKVNTEQSRLAWSQSRNLKGEPFIPSPRGLLGYGKRQTVTIQGKIRLQQFSTYGCVRGRPAMVVRTSLRENVPFVPGTVCCVRGSQLSSETVLADANGVATAEFTAGGGTVDDIRILAAGPLTSGQVQFTVQVVLPDP